MKKKYVRPEIEVVEMSGLDHICRASIYDENNKPLDVVPGGSGEGPNEPVWIDD